MCAQQAHAALLKHVGSLGFKGFEPLQDICQAGVQGKWTGTTLHSLLATHIGLHHMLHLQRTCCQCLCCSRPCCSP